MKRNQPSVTAEHNAVLRSHEFMRPEDERICSDPYAAFFLPDRFFSATDKNDQIRQAIVDWEARFPGICNAIIARTRFIDDCLEEAISDGIRQLVILGAGYDTRAIRFERLKNSATVFELDHPITQKRKLERIKKYIHADLSHIRYIPIDFSKEELADKLSACGYENQLKTMFIWEGVTYYIAAAAVDRTLDYIAHHAAVNSSVIFDYFPPSVANGTTQLVEARALRDGLQRIGEEIIFGLASNQIIDFMGARGFTVIKHLTRTDYKKAYFKGANRSRNVSDIFRFVQAIVC